MPYNNYPLVILIMGYYTGQSHNLLKTELEIGGSDYQKLTTLPIEEIPTTILITTYQAAEINNGTQVCSAGVRSHLALLAFASAMQSMHPGFSALEFVAAGSPNSHDGFMTCEIYRLMFTSVGINDLGLNIDVKTPTNYMDPVNIRCYPSTTTGEIEWLDRITTNLNNSVKDPALIIATYGHMPRIRNLLAGLGHPNMIPIAAEAILYNLNLISLEELKVIAMQQAPFILSEILKSALVGHRDPTGRSMERFAKFMDDLHLKDLMMQLTWQYGHHSKEQEGINNLIYARIAASIKGKTVT